MKLFPGRRAGSDRLKFVSAAESLGYVRTGSQYAREVIRKQPVASGAVMIGLGMYIIGFCIFALSLETSGGGREAAILGSIIFIPVGIALIPGGINELLKRTLILVEADRVHYERRTLSGTYSFDASLDDYLCVVPESLLVSHKGELRGMAYFGRIMHRADPAKDLGLLIRTNDEIEMLGDAGNERADFERFARHLDLPLASVRADGTVLLRAPDRLDEPLAAATHGTGEGQISLPSALPTFPARGFKVALNGNRFVADKGYPVYFIPCAGFIAAGVAIVFIVPAADVAGSIVLVLGMFALFMLAFALTTSRLTVSDVSLSVEHRIAGIRFMARSTPLDQIEEVDIVVDPATRRRTVRIGDRKSVV